MKNRLFIFTILISWVNLGFTEETYRAPDLDFKSSKSPKAVVKKSHWDSDYKIEDVKDSDREIASDEEDEYISYPEDDTSRGPSSKKEKKRSPNSSTEDKKFRPKKWEYKEKY